MGLAGAGAPQASTNVGSRSRFAATARVEEAGFTLPGQRMMKGTRTPPSQVVPLPSRSPPVTPA